MNSDEYSRVRVMSLARTFLSPSIQKHSSHLSDAVKNVRLIEDCDVRDGAIATVAFLLLLCDVAAALDCVKGHVQPGGDVLRGFAVRVAAIVVPVVVGEVTARGPRSAQRLRLSPNPVTPHRIPNLAPIPPMPPIPPD